jgi:hypothetical protein
MGADQGIRPWVSALVIGRSWWEAFWVCCGWFFSWVDGGGEEETPGHVLVSHFFRRTTRVSEQPFFLCYILYIEQWEFRYIKFQTIAKSALDLDAQWRGWCTSFLHGLHGVVGMVSYTHVVYVTCYFCYMFSLGPSSGSTGSVQIYRSTCER